MPRFKATIIRQFRGVDTASQKVLLQNVVNLDTQEEYRDHCWVDYTAEIEKFIPFSNKTKLVIEFTAKTKVYKIPYREEKIGLCPLKNIKLVK